MNDATLTELKIVVERAVRPLRATMARKRRMREELLVHLVAIFDEEKNTVAMSRPLSNRPSGDSAIHGN